MIFPPDFTTEELFQTQSCRPLLRLKAPVRLWSYGYIKLHRFERLSNRQRLSGWPTCGAVVSLSRSEVWQSLWSHAVVEPSDSVMLLLRPSYVTRKLFVHQTLPEISNQLMTQLSNGLTDKIYIYFFRIHPIERGSKVSQYGINNHDLFF